MFVARPASIHLINNSVRPTRRGQLKRMLLSDYTLECAMLVLEQFEDLVDEIQ